MIPSVFFTSFSVLSRVVSKIVMKPQIVIVWGVLLCAFLLSVSCSPVKIEGTIRIIDEQGNAVSGVNYLQNTDAYSRPLLYSAPHPKDQNKIKIVPYKTDINGYVGYSAELYQPSRAYLLFYKEGYYPSFVTFADVRKYGYLVLVNSKSQCLQIRNMKRSYMGIISRSSDSVIMGLTRRFGNDNKKNISRVAKKIEELGNKFEYMYSASDYPGWS